MICEYDKASFIIDGKYNLTPCSVYNTSVFKKYGYKHMEQNQIINDLTILSPDYFSPIREKNQSWKLLKIQLEFICHQERGILQVINSKPDLE